MTAARTAELTPRFAEGDAMRVIGLAERYDAGTMGRIPQQWQSLQQRLGEVRGRTEVAQFGLFHPIGGSPFEAEYVTGVMVADDAPPPAGFVERRLPARRHAVFIHRGASPGSGRWSTRSSANGCRDPATSPTAIPTSSRSTAKTSTGPARGRDRGLGAAPGLTIGGH